MNKLVKLPVVSILIATAAAVGAAQTLTLGIIPDMGAGKTDGTGCALLFDRLENNKEPSQLVFCEGWMIIDGKEIQFTHVKTVLNGKETEKSRFVQYPNHIDDDVMLDKDYSETWTAEGFTLIIRKEKNPEEYLLDLSSIKAKTQAKVWEYCVTP